MVCPIWRVVGFVPGFAPSRAATGMPSLAAMEVNVSPDWILYVLLAEGGGCWGGVGAGSCGAGGAVVTEGMLIFAPTWRLLGFRLGFAASRAATDVPNLAAMDVNVSPF